MTGKNCKEKGKNIKGKEKNMSEKKRLSRKKISKTFALQ